MPTSGAERRKDELEVQELNESVYELRVLREVLRDGIRDLNTYKTFTMPPPPSHASGDGWNFNTYSIYINQRFVDLSLQLQQRFEAQQQGLSTAMVAAEKAVTAALTAAEKAVDKAEQAQALRNEAQNEFRKSLADLSALMWTIKEGNAALDSLRRELEIRITSIDEKVNDGAKTWANLQGRFTMVGVIWGVVVVGISVLLSWGHFFAK
jgi:hypothetical protein